MSMAADPIVPVRTNAERTVSTVEPEYKAWHQTRLFLTSQSRSRRVTYYTELVAVHAVAVEDGGQAAETPCGLAVQVDVTGERNFDQTQPINRCEMCARALGLLSG
jgi:hypothetical protein